MRRQMLCGASLAGLLLTAMAGSALAQATAVPSSRPQMALSFAPLVRADAPAVVNVYSKRMVRTQLDPFWSLFTGGGLARSRIEQSLGSGSIVRADGVILTNHHNIEGAQEIRVVTADRREWPAKVLLDDPRADLAVLKIDPKGEALPTIPIDAKGHPQVGDLVLAIGDPFGVGQTVTNGIVSALARSDVGINDYAFFIQTDAAINPGNSGGPLVDMKGDLIGVNTAILSSSGASAGVGFAIPAAMAQQVLDAALAGETQVVRPWLGARTQSLTAEMAQSFGMAAATGAVVSEVWPGGPAAEAGLQAGDVILSVDGASVDDAGALNYLIATRTPGDHASLKIRRGAATRFVSLPIARPRAVPPRDARTLKGENPLAGATVINLSPLTAQEEGVDPLAHGVIVTALGDGFAQRIGLRVGDIIRAVNGTPVETTATLAAILAGRPQGWALTIQRGDQMITARFGG